MELMKYSITLLLINQSSTDDSHHHNNDVSGTGCKRDLAKPLNFYMEYLNRKYQIKGDDVGLNTRDAVNPRILLVHRSSPRSKPCRQLFLQNTSVEVYPFLTVQHAKAAVYVSSARAILVAKSWDILSFNIDSHKKVLWKGNVPTLQMVVDNDMKLVFLSLLSGFARVKTDGKEFKSLATSLDVIALATDTYNRIVYVFSSTVITSFTYDGKKLKHTSVEQSFVSFAQVYPHKNVLYYANAHNVFEISLRSNTRKVIKALSFIPKSAVFYKHNVYLIHYGNDNQCNFTIIDLLNKTMYSFIQESFPDFCDYATALIE